MPHRLRSLPPWLAITLLSVSASAQTPAPPAASDPADRDRPAATVSEEIVVSASRREQPRGRVASSVTVIDRAEIEARREPSLAELLRTVPGVEVVRTGPPGGATSVFLRGAASAHTLVLVDGVRVNSPAVGSFDWADLPTDDVERIEVLRGPQSALYGSEAIGGVVSVFTRRGAAGADRRPTARATAEAGGYDSHRLAASLRVASPEPGGWDASLGASRRRFAGVSSASEAQGNTEPDPYALTSLTATAGHRLRGDGHAGLAVRWLDSTAGLDGFSFLTGGPVDDPNYRQSRRALYLSADLAQPLGERVVGRLHAGTAREDYRATDPDTPFQRLTLDTRVSDLTVETDLRLAGDPAAAADDPRASGGSPAVGFTDGLTFGGAFERREADDPGFFERSAEIVSAFVENRFVRGDRLALTAGVRYDDHSQLGGETTWRGTASWRPIAATRLHGTWGTGFRAPSFNELYFPGFGNPDLAAETSTGWDAGVERSFAGGRVVADLTGWSSDVENLIGFDTVTFRAENVAAAAIDGVEASLEWRLAPGLSGRAAYTRTDARDEATGEPLARRPKHRASALVTWSPPGRWDGSLAAVAVRDRVDSGGAPLDDYERVDVSVGYDLARGLTAYLRVDNLLDDRAAELAGYTTPGTVATIGLRWGS